MSVLYIYLYALQFSFVTVCYMCALWAKTLCNSTDAAVFDLSMSSLFVFPFGLKRCIFLRTFTSLCAQDHANVSLCLFSAFILVSSLLFDFFDVTAEEGYLSLVYLLGRVTRRYCERIIISTCCSTFCVRQMCVWAAQTSHSCPTSASQCRCSSTDPARQGRDTAPCLISVRHAHHTRAQ